MDYPKLTKNEFHFFKKLLQKKYRQEEQKFIIEGYHLVEEALKTNLVETIITSDPKIKINFNNIKVATAGQIEWEYKPDDLKKEYTIVQCLELHYLRLKQFYFLLLNPCN